MDPRIAMQGDIPVRHPLERARQRGEAADQQEERKAELERQARREQIEAQLAQRAAIERQEILQYGYTTAELAKLRAEESAAKEEQIAALQEQMDRLDPARAQVKRARTAAAEDDRLLEAARASANDPFMADQLRRFRQRQGREVSRSRRPFDVLTRSEQCLWCTEQNVSDEESYLLHSDPQFNLPVTPPGRAEDAGQQQAEADQRRYGGTGWPAEISR